MNTPVESGPNTLEELEEVLSRPTEGVLRTISQLEGELLILGAGGKMGPSLARMAKRAAEETGQNLRVMAASRFSSSGLVEQLHAWGIETYSCDLLDATQLTSLPDARNILVMTGLKFGTGSNPAMTWAMNCHLPALVCQRFRHSRIGAFSSGNVYGLTSVAGGGSLESDPLQPRGEYATTVLGRERMYEYFSREWNIPVVMLRLNYATELRYGVLVDLARQVWQDETIDLSMGHVNVIWQADANAMSLESLPLAAVPPEVINIAGHEMLEVRETCETLGRLMGRPVRFTGTPQATAFLNNASKSHQLFGLPPHDANRMLEWTARWVMANGEYNGKPTHFQDRAGAY